MTPFASEFASLQSVPSAATASPIRSASISPSSSSLSITTATNASLSSTVSTSVPQTHTVNVGRGNFHYVPDTINANVGDLIEFRFFPSNHSVARAEYQKPCLPYELINPGKVGFFSGFKPVNAILDDPPKFDLLINDTDPIFFYCSAVGSCIGNQMVGVINPNSSQSLEIQKAAAKVSDFMVIPGNGFPSEDGSTNGDGGSTPSHTSKHTELLSPGGIAGIAIASIAIALLSAAFIILTKRHSHILQNLRRPSNPEIHPESFIRSSLKQEINDPDPRISDGRVLSSSSTPMLSQPGTSEYKPPVDDTPPPLTSLEPAEMHELPTSEPKGNYSITWNSYDEALNPSNSITSPPSAPSSTSGLRNATIGT